MTVVIIIIVIINDSEPDSERQTSSSRWKLIVWTDILKLLLTMTCVIGGQFWQKEMTNY